MEGLRTRTRRASNLDHDRPLRDRLVTFPPHLQQHIEELNDLVEEAVLQECERTAEGGGVPGAMETG